MLCPSVIYYKFDYFNKIKSNITWDGNKFENENSLAKIFELELIKKFFVQVCNFIGNSKVYE